MRGPSIVYQRLARARSAKYIERLYERLPASRIDREFICVCLVPAYHERVVEAAQHDDRQHHAKHPRKLESARKNGPTNIRATTAVVSPAIPATPPHAIFRRK
jgi:hypothetical protein